MVTYSGHAVHKFHVWDVPTAPFFYQFSWKKKLKMRVQVEPRCSSAFTLGESVWNYLKPRHGTSMLLLQTLIRSCLTSSSAFRRCLYASLKILAGTGRALKGVGGVGDASPKLNFGAISNDCRWLFTLSRLAERVGSTLLWATNVGMGLARNWRRVRSCSTSYDVHRFSLEFLSWLIDFETVGLYAVLGPMAPFFSISCTSSFDVRSGSVGGVVTLLVPSASAKIWA